VIFYTLWISLMMGYIVLMSGRVDSLGFLSGGFGYEANVILFGFLKWGSLVIIILILFFFVISAYKITSLGFLQDIRRKKTPEPQEENEEPEEKTGGLRFPNLFRHEKEPESANHLPSPFSSSETETRNDE